MIRWRPLLVLVLLPSLLGAAPAPVHRFLLGAGLAAELDGDGAVVVTAADSDGAFAAAATDPLLSLIPVLSSHARRASLTPPPLVMVTGAGAPGGHRGILQPADDDGDGLADEDPLNGRDDDGDGLIDEDFAAISDEMGVIDLPGGPHLELYHWDHPHVSAALFLTMRSRGGDGAAEKLRLGGDDIPWRELLLPGGTRSWSRSGTVDRSPETCRVARLHRNGEDVWLGLLLFDGALRRGGQGELTLETAPVLTAVLVAARSPVRLVGTLQEAISVREGAPLRPGGAPVPWIVTPPPCPDLAVGAITAGWWPERDGWQLTLSLPAECRWLPDPTTLRLGGRACGLRLELILPDGGSHEIVWSADADALDPVVAYLALFPVLNGGSNLRIWFPGPPPRPETPDLTGDWPFGGSFAAIARRQPAPAEVADAQPHPPSLSPDLLHGYPNPFRQRTTLEFRVPATVGEGFVWDQQRPPSLKADDPIPFTSPVPQATLKIYTISGREIVTLYDQPSAPGTYRVDWDGTDQTGRLVAMGTYFCKLQVGQWSVTKRLSIIR